MATNWPTAMNMIMANWKIMGRLPAGAEQRPADPAGGVEQRLVPGHVPQHAEDDAEDDEEEDHLDGAADAEPGPRLPALGEPVPPAEDRLGREVVPAPRALRDEVVELADQLDDEEHLRGRGATPTCRGARR